MKYLLLLLLLGVRTMAHAEPDDSITVRISAEESVQFLKFTEVSIDSTFAVPHKVIYEETKGIATLVYSWVNQMPRFVYGVSETPDTVNAFHKYVKGYGLYTNASDTCNATYDAVVERDGSISNLQRIHGNGDSIFHNKVERMLLDMPRWEPGHHKGNSQRVWVRLRISNPDNIEGSSIQFVGKPRIIKDWVVQPNKSSVTRIPARVPVQKRIPLRRKTFSDM